MLVLGAQSSDFRFERLPFEFESTPLALHFFLLFGCFRAFRRFLVQTCRPGEHPACPEVNVDELDPMIAQNKLADLIRMCRAAGLEHVEAAIALAVELDVPEEKPRVHQ